MEASWKTVKSKKVYENPYFWILEDDVIKPDGSPGKFYVMHRRTGVAVIPYNGRRVYLVNQYRYTSKERLWEVPAGRAESDDLLAEAKKELREETGLLAAKWTRLGHFLCAPGLTDHDGHVFLAEELTQGEHEREGGESDMIVRAFSLPEIDKMIAREEIVDSWTITPLYFLKQYLSKKL